MIRLFAKLAGELPTFKQAGSFAARHELALRHTTTEDWGSALDAYRAEQREGGEPVPPGPTPRRRRFNITVPDGALDGLPRRYGHGQWQANPDLALDKLEEYLDGLPDGQEPGTAHYKTVKKRHARADWPHCASSATTTAGSPRRSRRSGDAVAALTREVTRPVEDPRLTPND